MYAFKWCKYHDGPPIRCWDIVTKRKILPWKKSPQGKIPLEILKGNPGQNDYQNDPQNDPQNDGQNETPKNAIFYRKIFYQKSYFF